MSRGRISPWERAPALIERAPCAFDRVERFLREMAVEGDVQGEATAHRRGYSLFTAIMKWGAIVSFILTMLVVFMISS